LLPPSARPLRGLLIYPSLSIGNFAPDAAARFVSRIRVLCGSDGRPPLGIDLVENMAVIEAAYDDALRFTAAFNPNILSNIYRILGSRLDAR